VDDPQQRCPDINLAKQLLQWHPNTQLQEGLGKTINYFRTCLQSERWAHLLENK
jgi:UDP-glucuronate decarboxylase